MKNSLIQRLWILAILLCVVYSTVWLLPSGGETVASRLSKKLPDSFAEWSSRVIDVSEVERRGLAADTEFVRRYYKSAENSGFAGVEVSVVFSGKDMNNSIHRPERCLRAQGWNFQRERTLKLPNMLPDGGDLNVREILCVRPRVQLDGEKALLNNEGEPIYDQRLQYYTFFGSSDIVSGHYDRAFADIKTRLFYGVDQQWAYATFSVPVTSVYRDQGFNIADSQVFTVEQSAEVLEGFMRQLMPKIVGSPSN